ncbi:SDR family oxidoreductase [Agrococcus jejuensis]|uniref:SDR family oxidoreductase n=1 Tax=Agrococcus jejuensis TaxID=399736 RepID=UPI0011A66B52|nr:SDR family oxidoreductase [Agrococcus jejuensis]
MPKHAAKPVEPDDLPAEPQATPTDHPRRILVLGATGYLGGRLAPRLVARGHVVRALVRNPDRLAGVPWEGDVDVVRGDLADPESVRAAMQDIDVVYHLVHSMSAGGDFETEEAQEARNVADAAKDAGVGRIVYLGGLHPDGELSQHLRSRVAVGEVLLASGVPTIVLQAGIVIGSGSASFEMIRHLTEVLPYMPAPRWVRNFVQPIAVRDVLHYLIESATLPDDVHGAYDVGGPDVLRYGQMMNGYAVEAGLPQRPIAPLPVLTPWLASHWVNLVTPVPRSIAVPLIGSLIHDCVMRDHRIDDVIARPEAGLVPYRRAVALALKREKGSEVETSWRDAAGDDAPPSDPLPSDPDWAGTLVLSDERERESTAPPEAVWRIVEGIGGENGWYSMPLLWAARGWMDRIAGGAGLAGRRDPRRIRVGEQLDWWRVEDLQPGRSLRLRAEMRVPGRAWLELSVEPHGEGSRYRQRAVFFPKGLSGRLYWLGVTPFHHFIFQGMAERITAEAEQLAAGDAR